MGISIFVPFGVRWPSTSGLKARCVREREAFAAWIRGLDVSEEQRVILAILLGMVEEAELVDARCAGVTYLAEVARRAGGLGDIDGLLQELVDAGHVALHSAADVFGEKRPGVVFRIRRPDVVLTVESAGYLWTADAWPRKRAA